MSNRPAFQSCVIQTLLKFRAVAYHFESDGKNDTEQYLSYHGDLNSKQREANLKLFREGKSQVKFLIIYGPSREFD
jgi:hypothetical protein